MQRRAFLKASAVFGALGAASACSPAARYGVMPIIPNIMTVTGRMSSSEMGLTLAHEHLLLDMRPLAEQRGARIARDYDKIASVVMPHLVAAKDAGCATLIEATATGFGRSPVILKQLSEASGVNIIMGTGLYLAAGAPYIPDYAESEDAETLAARWVGEFTNGIGASTIKPGFIKLGLEGGPLTPLDIKIVEAAALAHLATGMAIGVHIGPWRRVEPGWLGQGATQVVERLRSSGVSPQAMIWIHAQNEVQRGYVMQVAEAGATVSHDGYRPGQEEPYLRWYREMKAARLLNRVHFSQDAGWYTLGEPGGGTFLPIDPILTTLMPYLRENGVTPYELDRIFKYNPRAVFGLQSRPV